MDCGNIISPNVDSLPYMETINRLCDFPLKSSKNIIFQNPFIFGFYRHVQNFTSQGFSLYYIFRSIFAFLEKNSFEKKVKKQWLSKARVPDSGDFFYSFIRQKKSPGLDITEYWLENIETTMDRKVYLHSMKKWKKKSFHHSFFYLYFLLKRRFISFVGYIWGYLGTWEYPQI